MYSCGVTHEQKGVIIHETPYTKHVFIFNDRFANDWNHKVYAHIKDVWLIADVNDMEYDPRFYIEEKLSFVTREYISNVSKVEFMALQPDNTGRWVRFYSIVPLNFNNSVAPRHITVDVSTGLTHAALDVFSPQVDFYFEFTKCDDEPEGQRISKLVVIVEAPLGFDKEAFKFQIVKHTKLILVGQRNDPCAGKQYVQRAIQVSESLYGKFRKEVKLPTLNRDCMKYNDKATAYFDVEGCVRIIINVEYFEIL